MQQLMIGALEVRPVDAAPVIQRISPIKSMADLERYCTFRSCVEAGAAASAAEFRNHSDIDALHAALDALIAAMNSNRSGLDEDLRFHLAIARASHNPLYVATVENCAGPMRQCIELANRVTGMEPSGCVDDVHREHLAIVDAIARGSQSQAVEAVRAHLVSARRHIFEGMPATLIFGEHR